MSTLFWVALGGAIGSAARYFVTIQAMRLAPGFPWGTLAVNILGCLLMGLLAGVLAGALAHRFDAPDLHAFLGVGLLGGFTTFSTFSLDAMLLWERGAAGLAAVYVLVSVAASLGALLLGFWLARSVAA